MDDLAKVKYLAKNYSALIVEDSQALVKQQVHFLSKFFKNVYTAKDGQDGLDQYLKYYPDIIFTDLNMPKLNGLDMTQEILKVNTCAKIVVISAHTDTDTLLDCLHHGVADFIPKPINSELLLRSLSRILSTIQKENVQADNTQITNDDELNQAFQTIKANKTKVSLLNDYMGVPISHDATVIEFHNDSVELHTNETQIYLLNLNKEVIIDSDEFKYPIHGSLDYIDAKSNNIILKNIKYTDKSIKDRKELRVVPNSDFKFVINDSKGKIIPKVVDISTHAVAVVISNIPTDFEIGKKMALSIAIEQKHSSTFNVKSNDYLGPYGKIFKIEKHGEDTFVVLEFEISKSDQEILSKYILHRELQIIKDLKQRMVK